MEFTIRPLQCGQKKEKLKFSSNFLMKIIVAEWVDNQNDCFAVDAKWTDFCEKSRQNVCRFTENPYLCNRKRKNAEIAQLVEHNLAKVRVASSSLVFRSCFFEIMELSFAQVAELVDAHVSGACVERHAGSSPVLGTKVKQSVLWIVESKLERWRNW